MASSTSTTITDDTAPLNASGGSLFLNLPISIISESQVLIGTKLHTLTEPIGHKNYQRAEDVTPTAYHGDHLHPMHYPLSYSSSAHRPISKRCYAYPEQSRPLPMKAAASPETTLRPKTSKSACKIPIKATNIKSSKFEREATTSGKWAEKPSSKASVKPSDLKRITAAILAVNIMYEDGNEVGDKLSAAESRGVTMRPSGKWQAQLYYSGKSRYIGVYDTKEKAFLAYEIAREVLKGMHRPTLTDDMETDWQHHVALARKAASVGVYGHHPDS